MFCSLGLLACVGLVPDELLTSVKPDDVFSSYTTGYHTAKRLHKPMLVILNPGKDSEEGAYSLEHVRKTRQRRELLRDYVVVMIDTSTQSGQTVHELFGSKKLPRVSVIDREQRVQLLQKDGLIQGVDWTEILETYRKGVAVPKRTAQWCPT